MQAKKQFRRFIRLVLIALVVVLAYPLRGGDSLRAATADQITQQVPAALDILSARHPIKVGILRSVFNTQGSVDRLAEDYVRSTLSQENMGVLECYVVYYFVAFDRDDFRQTLANSLEKKLGLA